ncbi:hypothetical protein C7H84_32955 [Burkholderia sp. Nafp2/4-1b]|uniref:hypothetical protein n=1 Tax=Burkholderia sp. Nafp2/4-1b TaxID=2116686 RepID=UPI000EF89F1C|nr:hypothetical protein [Burkholderia sp. Nafp2/4-1b]RKT99157.1 hypothetical protein C7H84_32955 [Burkholderia sp. Nafp2/4-1b]
MKLATAIAAAFVGAVLATIICWGALTVYGVFVLRGEGSLFDTNPEIANLFFVGWGGLIAILATAGATVVIRRKSANRPTDNSK